jgi:hypothetical protein
VLQWLPFLLLPAAAGFWLWGKYRKRQRRPAVAGFASQHGLSYSEAGYVDSTGYDFPLLRVRTGDRNGYNNVLAGRWQGLPVRGADYWYCTTTNMSDDIPAGGGGNYHNFSILVADLPATVPYVSVQAKDALTRVFHRVGLPPLPDFGRDSVAVIGFEPEDFNQKFQVTAVDEQFATKLIDAAMIQWLMSTGGEFAFEVGGCNLLVSCDLLPVTGLVRLFDAAKGFVDHIPHLVWAEYRGQAADPRDGAPPR